MNARPPANRLKRINLGSRSDSHKRSWTPGTKAVTLLLNVLRMSSYPFVTKQVRTFFHTPTWFVGARITSDYNPDREQTSTYLHSRTLGVLLLRTKR